jgi:hypothetical protein
MYSTSFMPLNFLASPTPHRVWRRQSDKANW